MKEEIKIKTFLMLIMIEIIYFLTVNYSIYSNENEEIIKNLTELGFYFDKMNILVFYVFTLMGILLINALTIEIEYFKKHIEKILLFSFLILTCLSFQLKDFKIQEEKDFIETTKQPIEINVYKEIESELNTLKRNIEPINNEQLKEQYYKTIKVMNNVNYPITEIEYKTFLKEKENCYKIYNEINIKEEYERIKKFK